MSDSLYSIYQKYCPQCMTASPAAVERCACGYRFSESASASRWQQVLEDERLYEDYLAARAAQAAQAAVEARAAHQADPEDPLKKAAALKAIDDAETARAALAAQAARITQMTTHRGGGAPRVVPSTAVFRGVSQAPAKTPTPPAPHTPVEPRSGVSAKAVVEAAKALQAELAQMRRAEPSKATESAKKRRGGESGEARAPAASSPDKVQSKPVAQATPPGAPPASAKPATPPKPVTPQTHAGEQPVSGLDPQACPHCTAVLPHGAQACRCGYRASSAALADVAPPKAASARSAAGAGDLRLARDAEAVAPTSESTKSDPQAVRVSPTRTKECPHCTASLALGAARCKCGYVFPSIDRGGLMPALSIDPAELQALTKRS